MVKYRDTPEGREEYNRKRREDRRNEKEEKARQQAQQQAQKLKSNARSKFCMRRLRAERAGDEEAAAAAVAAMSELSTPETIKRGRPPKSASRANPYAAM